MIVSRHTVIYATLVALAVFGIMLLLDLQALHAGFWAVVSFVAAFIALTPHHAGDHL